MPARKKPQPESKQGLVVTLVFFILATIGLGVATYYAFAEQATLDAKAKEEKKKYDEMAKVRDYYKTLAGLLRAYSGNTPQGDDLQALVVKKGEFDSGNLGKTEKDRPEYEAHFAKLKKDFN